MFSGSFQAILRDKKAAQLIAEHYCSQKPFPHILLNDVIDPYRLAEILRDFPQPDGTWWQYSNPLERKFAKDNALPHSLRKLIYMYLHSRDFVTFLERLTGIPHLIPDPTLRGGGCHAITRGGVLHIHADHNVHPNLKLDRRVNLILYLNPGWRDEWGGHLELWNKEMTECQAKIPPLLGNMAIFNTTSESYHGHPDPLMCPEGTIRKSIALYYWTNGRPESEQRPQHSTIYKKRPGDPDDAELDKLREQRAKGRI